ncbi:golgin subfamily A member 4-like [Argonauta hians]
MGGSADLTSVVNENKYRHSGMMEVNVEEEVSVKQSEEESKHFNLLSSRLEEQTDLIRMLEERIQNTELEVVKRDENNKILDQHRNNIMAEIKEDMKLYKIQRDHYTTLQKNYMELREVAEQYKLKNKLLTDKMKGLQDANEKMFGAARCEILDEVESLKKIYFDLKEECESTAEKIVAEETSAENLKETMAENMKYQKEQHKIEVERLMLEMEQFQIMAQEADQCVDNLNKIPPESADLEKEVEQLEALKNKAEDDIAKKEKVLADKTVISLKREIEEVKSQRVKAQQEIKTYKEESRKLLEEEKKLNEKLRHLPS